MAESDGGVRAVILAGGRGRRLEPYTSVLPKPLMPVGDRSIVEILVEQLAECGITRITLCVGYLGHLIRAVFNGRPGPSVLDYVREETPLGTAGPLRLVDGLDKTFLVMNGDLLTDIDYSELLEHHRRAGNVLTIAAHRRRNTIDYGVLHLDGPDSTVTGFDEKPELALTVSMGIYVMEPSVLEHIPDGYFDFPDLVQALLGIGERVGAYPFDGFWLDIGRRDDYEIAIERWAARTGPAAD